MVYIVLLLVIPPDATTLTRYDLSVTDARILSLVVILPYIAIWFAAFYGFIKVKEYAWVIRGTKDGKGWAQIGDGLMVIAVSLPLTAIAATMRSYLATQDSSLRPSLTIIYNYLALGLVLLGFYLISRGAQGLMGTVKKHKLTGLQWLQAVAAVSFCILYAMAVMTSPSRNIAEAGNSTSTYYLPDWLLFATIVVPYLLVWFFGFRAAFFLRQYRRGAKGLLYKQALQYFSSGTVFIVGSLILIRVLNSMSSLFHDVSLRALLLILYVFLVIVGVGYLYVALGAKKLKRIEEV